MRFIGLKIFIWTLKLAAFCLIVPSLIVIGWALTSEGSAVQVAGSTLVAAICVGGAIFVGVLIAAFAGVLELLICIERNTANASENTARIIENTKKETSGPAATLSGDGTSEPPTYKDEGVFKRFVKDSFTPIRPGKS